jgi:hypothetical protein
MKLLFVCGEFRSVCIFFNMWFSHGYGRWQDIANDPKFVVINEPFRRGKLSLDQVRIRVGLSEFSQLSWFGETRTRVA